jgi:hypothetical protein
LPPFQEAEQPVSRRSRLRSAWNAGPARRRLLVVTAAAGLAALSSGAVMARRAARTPDAPPLPPQITLPEIDLTRPVRPEPVHFPADTHLPPIRERAASSPVDPARFSPSRDLVRVDDVRAWWESDHDEADDEDDHAVHRSLEIPLRRLIELVSQRGGRLKIQDTFRPTGIHNPRSLHKEGRAVDVTCDELGLPALARLCWAAGFDWVYLEASAKGGPHVHCSVRP